MIHNHKNIIDNLVNEAVSILINKFSSKQTQVESDNLYDIKINLNYDKSNPSSIRQIIFSYDKDAGYFLNIDGMSFEFDQDVNSFRNTSMKYLMAISEDRLSVTEEKKFWIFKTYKLNIIDE